MIHILRSTVTFVSVTAVVVLYYIANRVRRATSFRWRASYRVPTPYSSDACTQPRLCLISGGTSAPVIQPLSLLAPSLSRPVTASTASMNSRQICCSGLRRPSCNHCCSGGHRTTTAAPVAIAQQLLRRLSHSQALLYRSPTVLQNLLPAP